MVDKKSNNKIIKKILFISIGFAISLTILVAGVTMMITYIIDGDTLQQGNNHWESPKTGIYEIWLQKTAGRTGTVNVFSPDGPVGLSKPGGTGTITTGTTIHSLQHNFEAEEGIRYTFDDFSGTVLIRESGQVRKLVFGIVFLTLGMFTTLMMALATIVIVVLSLTQRGQ